MGNAPRIPRIIHYCWYGGAPLSELSRRCVETWRAVMPDFAYEKWDEGRLDRSIPYVDQAYRARRFAFVADYMRMKVLHEHGGVYLDTDMEVMRSLDALLDDQLFMGFQAPDSIGCGVIGAVKGHPFLRAVLDRLDDEARRGKPSYQPIPELVSGLMKGARASGATLFPEEYFYPYNPYSPVLIRRKPLQSNMTERTYAIHHWEGAWLGESSLSMMIGLRAKAVMRKINPARRRILALPSEALRP